MSRISSSTRLPCCLSGLLVVALVPSPYPRATAKAQAWVMHPFLLMELLWLSSDVAGKVRQTDETMRWSDLKFVRMALGIACQGT